MQIVSYRVRGDKKITALGDDGKNYHFLHAENALNWLNANATGGPTLASISPTTAVSVSGADLTVTLTGTNFKSASTEVWIDGYGPYARTFVSATSMTIVLKPSTVPAPKTIQIGVRDGLYVSATRPFVYT
jgi:hypothetical protein